MKRSTQYQRYFLRTVFFISALWILYWSIHYNSMVTYVDMHDPIFWTSLLLLAFNAFLFGRLILKFRKWRIDPHYAFLMPVLAMISKGIFLFPALIASSVIYWRVYKKIRK